MTRVQGVMLERTIEATALREFMGQLLADPTVFRQIVDIQQGNDVRHEMHCASSDPRVGTFSPMIPEALESTRRARAVLLVRDRSEAEGLESYAHAIDVIVAPDREPRLVRPDGFIAWTGDRVGLDETLQRWFVPRRDARVDDTARR